MADVRTKPEFLKYSIFNLEYSICSTIPQLLNLAKNKRKRRNRSRVQRFRVHVKFDPLILEFCDLPRQCNVTAGGKTRENKTI